MPDEDDDVPDEDDDFEMVLIADQDLEAVSVSMGEHCTVSMGEHCTVLKGKNRIDDATELHSMCMAARRARTHAHNCAHAAQYQESERAFEEWPTANDLASLDHPHFTRGAHEEERQSEKELFNRWRSVISEALPSARLLSLFALPSPLLVCQPSLTSRRIPARTKSTAGANAIAPAPASTRNRRCIGCGCTQRYDACTHACTLTDMRWFARPLAPSAYAYIFACKRKN